MTANSFEDKFKDLNLTNDEIKRFSDAFKNEEFRKLFMEYAEELNDPKNRELYEQEIRAAEEERGSDVTFVHPKPGHVLKTIINGKDKCFINIATNEHVEKPSFTKAGPESGQKGANWSLPHCLAGPHEDLDHQSKSCTVYDVIFSPDTYRMAETNSRFMKMVEDSALESIERNYNCKLDRNNVKRPKMKFKGVPRPTIIRKKKEQTNSEQTKKVEQPSPIDEVIDKAISASQNHKVVLSSHNRQVNGSTSNTNESTMNGSSNTDENGFTIPNHRILHRGEFDMQDCTNSVLPQVRSLRPKELIVEIDLPLCASSNNVDLDVCERTLKVHCDSPKYSLDLVLPYPVRESESHARFDKKQRKLIVTLAVVKETAKIIEIDSPTETEQETAEEQQETRPSIQQNQIVPSIETKSIQSFSSIPFEYKQGQAHVALVLYVKNVDQTSVKIQNDGQHITIQLSSMGSGCFPLLHQLCLDFDEPSTFESDGNSTNVNINENNVLIIIKKSSPPKMLTQFFSGVSREDLKIHHFTNTVLNEKTMPELESMTKEPVKRENSSTSSSNSSTNGNDPKRKLSKKQAKKLAKKNAKTINQHDEDNEQNADDCHQIQSNDHDEKQPVIRKKSKTDDELSDSPSVRAHSTIYRRHMSESHADLGQTSNGEFKLKGILKNATKYRSYSESHSEAPSDLNPEYTRDESVFEVCSTTDDLSSSNENNSIGASTDSTAGHAGSSSLCSTPGSTAPVKHVTFNNQVSRKTFKPGGPVSGMKKVSSTQQRKLKKRRRQDSLNSQSSDQDDQAPPKSSEKMVAKPSDDYKNPIDMKDVISWQASGASTIDNTDNDGTNKTTSKSAVRFTNSLIFELEN